MGAGMGQRDGQAGSLKDCSHEDNQPPPHHMDGRRQELTLGARPLRGQSPGPWTHGPGYPQSTSALRKRGALQYNNRHVTRASMCNEQSKGQAAL